MWNNSPASWINASPLEVLISRATAASLHEPNYALHLEVADYINQKKANNPREAAMLIARLVNHRNPHVAMLALALLDTLVQSCGYPIYLQIATKDFLNELVRRFPERPPPFPSPVMSRVLDLINTWKEGICVESKWKDDLGNIRDMHRLLSFKGYRFRQIPRAAPSASATSNLKSAEELESEDRAAQSAKLQELIRRGTPRDLAAAQELMKALAGADPDARPDYRTQALAELNKLEQKVILLNEILDNVDTAQGEQFARGDVYEQVASILVASRPKIQKWISDAESDDPESLDTYLQINDQINTVLARYEAYKRGDFAAASNPIPSELGPGTTGLSLIDFDDAADAAAASAAAGAVGSGRPVDELADLFGPSAAATTTTSSSSASQQASNGHASILAAFNTSAQYAPSPYHPYQTQTQLPHPASQPSHAPGPGPAPPLQPRPPYPYPQTYPHPSPSPYPPGAPAQFAYGGAGGSASPQSRPTSAPFGQIMLPGTPSPHATGTGAGAGIGAGIGAGAGMSMATGGGAVGGQQAQTQTQTQGKDPFADLVGLF
ncbi:hypothetical protein HETIRDRAFT_461277 [Heterobasidion irregulare TC 32-1]|uniref:VHS domain-containing protein n=1 Tax=Heterobasidion irregulare (strain TC 32-1) TaxID=747525 RepID=W4JP38_HETIT|nr:uncharacterized protein HETIRDRAFT_461277 [Heterobasidion irregulare TC 32-1]ETW75322.1 hypothetical protein HETIRDRAFT_461277 [Heterobasidion irregulare TC 32-1]